MTRVVSIYLPDLPTDRIRRADPGIPPEQAIAVIARSGSKRWVSAADAAARKAGVHVGMPAAKAQALFRGLGCSGCHGPSATVHAPKLEGVYGHPVGLATSQTVIADDGYIRDSILQPKKQVVGGFDPIMPSYQGLITEDDLGKLVAYIKSLANSGGTP